MSKDVQTKKYVKPKVRHQCPYCDKTYCGQKPLQDHIILKHEKAPKYQCDICQGRYPSDVIFREHMKRVHAKVTCDLCESNFTRTELKKHRSKIHGIPNNDDQPAILPFKCPFCPKAFRTKLGLQRHSEIKHDTQIEVEMGSDIEIENEGAEVHTSIQFIV